MSNLRTNEPDYVDLLHPHDRFRPPHRPTDECVSRCNNIPPGEQPNWLWHEYDIDYHWDVADEKMRTRQREIRCEELRVALNEKTLRLLGVAA